VSIKYSFKYPQSINFNVSDFTPSESNNCEPIPLTKSGLSKTFNDFEKTCCSILSFKNEVPLAIADYEIALAKALKKPLAILLSKIILNFSLPIFCGLSFFIVFSAVIFPSSDGFFISPK